MEDLPKIYEHVQLLSTVGHNTGHKFSRETGCRNRGLQANNTSICLSVNFQSARSSLVLNLCPYCFMMYIVFSYVFQFIFQIQNFISANHH